MSMIKRMFELRLTKKEVRKVKKAVASIMLPLMLFYMTGINIVALEMMRAQAEDAEVAEDAPKKETPKIEEEAIPEAKDENKDEVEKEVEIEVKTEAPKTEEKKVEIAEEDVAPAKTLAPGKDEPTTPTVQTQATEGIITSEAASTEKTADDDFAAKPEWKSSTDGKTAEIGPVELEKTYKAPQNEKVTITFTKLPEKAGSLVIKEIKLSAEEMLSLGALSDTAYDITSNMENGTFEYDLTLPYPDKDSDGKAEVDGNSKNEVKADNLTVLYTKGDKLEKDEMTDVKDDNSVDKNTNKSKKVLELKGLDHFTVFVVATGVTDGSSSGDFCATFTGGVFGCYSTLTAAIAAAPEDAVIIIKAGSYTDTPTVNKDLTLELNGDVTFSGSFTVSGSSTNLLLKQHGHTLTATAIINGGSIENETGDGSIILVATTGDITARHITSVGDVTLTATLGSIFDDPSGAQTTYITGTNITLSALAGSIGTYVASPTTIGHFDGAVDVNLGSGVLTATALNDVAVTEVNKASINSSNYSLTSGTAGKYVTFGNLTGSGALTVNSVLDNDAIIRVVANNGLLINENITTSANNVEIYSKDGVALNQSLAAANLVSVKSGFDGGSGNIYDDGFQNTTISAPNITLNVNGGVISDCAPAGNGTINFLHAVDVALGGGTLTTNGGYITETGGVRNGAYNLGGGNLSLSKAFSGASTLTSPNGKLTISDSDTTANILIGEYSGSVAGGLSGAVPVGGYYEVQTEGTVSYPINVQLAYTDGEMTAAGIAETQLNGVYYYDTAWHMYPVGSTTVHRDTNIINISADHLTPIVAGADTTAPTVAITAPISGNVDGTTVITFTNNEQTNPQCSVDNTNWIPCASGITTLANIPEFLAHDNSAITLYLKDTDLVGNIGTDSKSLAKNDVTAPTVTLGALTPDPNNDNTPEFTGTVSDGSSNIASVEYQVDGTGGAWTAATVTGGNYTFTTGTLSDAAHTVYVRATDVASAANVSVTVSDGFAIDSTAPTFAIQYYSDSGLAPAASLGDNPKLKAGTYYIKITSSEALTATPTISIASEGSANDVTNGATTLVSGLDYIYTRTIAYDSVAFGVTKENISITGTDLVNNPATSVDPTNESDRAAYTDTISPTITVDTKNTNHSTPFLTGTWNDGTGAASIGIAIGGYSYTATIDYNGLHTWGVHVADALTNGVYNVVATITDLAGNVGNDTTASEVSIDNAAPVLSKFSSETTNGNYGIGSTINVTAEYNKNLDSGSHLIVTLDSGAGASVTLNNVSGHNISGTYTVAAGQNSTDLTVSAITHEDVNDTNGNNRSDSAIPAGNNLDNNANIVVDGVAPTVALTTPASNPTNSAFTVTATFSENVTGFAEDEFIVSNATKSSFTVVSGSIYTVLVTPSFDGLVTVDVAGSVAQDVVGNNNSAAAQLTRTYDGSLPIITIVNPDTAPAQSKTVTASTNEGTLTMFVNAAGVSTCGEGLAFIAYADTTFNLEADNTKTICYRAVDSAGNARYTVSSAIGGIDVTLPNITIVNPDTTPAQSKTVTASTNEGTLTMFVNAAGVSTCGEGLAFGVYSSTTFNLEADNTRAICYRVIDFAGNIRYALSDVIGGIDRTAPAVPNAPDLQVGSDSGKLSDDNITNDTTPTFDISGFTAPDKYRVYRGDTLVSGDESGATWTSGMLADGTYSFTVRSIDSLGNESVNSGALLVTIDTSAPSAPSSAPNLQDASDSGTSNSDNITSVTTPVFDIAGFGTDYYRVYKDGSLASGNYETSSPWTSGALGNGTYNFATRAVDTAGNESGNSTGLGVTIDTSAPTVVLTHDHADLIVRDADAVLITATFNEAMASAPTITIGTLVTAAPMTGAGTTWTYLWNVPSGSDGAATATVAGADLAGVAYAGGTILDFTVDNIQPTVAITNPTSNQFIHSDAGQITLASTTTDTNATTCTYRIDSGAEQAINCAGDSISGITDGRKTLTLTSTDIAGNSNSANVVFIMDTDGILGVDDTPGNNPDFATIQEAVNAASNGYTINVAAGIYVESVMVNKDVSIIGAGLTTVVDPATDQNGFLVNVDGVTIQNLRITLQTSGVDAQAVRLEGANSVTISGNIIETTGNKGIGIWIGGIGYTNSNNLMISNNTITIANESTGIYAERGNPAQSGWQITSNTITANLGNPLELYDVTSSTVNGNTLTTTSSGGSNVMWFAELSDLSNLTFSNNVINGSSGSEVAIGTGFQIASTHSISTVSITGNTFSNWGSRALRIGKVSGSGTVTGVAVSTNKFLSAGQAINNLDASTVNAAGNWWGNSTGPAHSTNPLGTGSSVSDNVNFRPWFLTDAFTGLDSTSPIPTISSSAGSSTGVSPIPISVNFGESVTGFDVTDITIGNGAVTGSSFSGLSGASSYTFTVTPSAPGTVTIDIAGGSASGIQDLSGNYSNAATQFSISYDTAPPTVSSVNTTHLNGNFKTGEVIDITVDFSKNVNVTGTPRLQFETGATDEYANYLSGTGTSTLTFRYTVASGDISSDLDYVTTDSLTLNGGTIRDAALNDAILTLPAVGTFAGAHAIVIDTTAPTLNPVTIISNHTNTNYAKVGSEITVTFMASETLIANPTATIAGNAATVASTANPNEYTAKYTMLLGDTAGIIPFIINFSDLAGNAGTAVTSTTNASNVTFDKTSPGEPDVRTEEGLWYKERPTNIDVDFSDSVMLQKVEYKLGSGGTPRTIADNINATSYTSNWPLEDADWSAMSQVDNYYLYFIVTDKAGNTYTTPNNNDGFWLRKDTSDPDAPDYNTAEGDTYTSNPELDIDFSDNGRIDTIEYKVDDSGSWHNIAGNVDHQDYTDNWSMDSGVWGDLGNGTHYIYFRITDMAGNIRTTGSNAAGFGFGKNTITTPPLGTVQGVQSGGGEEGQQVQGEEAVPGGEVGGAESGTPMPENSALPYEVAVAILLFGGGAWWWVRRGGRGAGAGGGTSMFFYTLKDAASKMRMFLW